jgi:WD repeat and SOF domain-containing protein 1
VRAAKLDRMFAKPFLGAMDDHSDGITCSSLSPTSLVSYLSGGADGEVIRVVGTLSDITGILADYLSTERQPGQSLFKWASLAITGYATADSGAATTITVSSTVGFVVGQYVTISGSSTAGYNGTWRIATVTSSTQLKLEVAFTADPTTDGTLYYSDALVIHPLFQSGGTEKIITFQNVALTGLPTLTFSATETPLGAVTFTAIYHRKLEADAVDAIVDYRTWSAPISTQLDDFDPDSIYTVPPRMRYGAFSEDAWTPEDPVAAPWKDFCTAAGATMTLNLGTADHVVDSCGLVDIKYTDLTVTVTAQPVGELATDEEVQKLLLQQNMGADGRKRGQSMKAATPMELILRMDGETTMYFNLPSSAVSSAANNYGTTAMRNGDLVWQGLRTFTSGVRQNIFTASIP